MRELGVAVGEENRRDAPVRRPPEPEYAAGPVFALPCIAAWNYTHKLGVLIGHRQRGVKFVVGEGYSEDDIDGDGVEGDG